MDFFEAQAHAKRRTTRLVFLFVLAVIGTIIACYAAASIIGLQMGGRQGRVDRVVFDPGLFATVTCVVIAVVGLASLFKWMQLREGGSAVAEMVGGRRIETSTTNLDERRLLNVVEEMAIASGVPVPAVYVLRDEAAINAFAAGLTTGDAVVAVTRGTMEKLTRDELQGVVAHEFSHILNGDMRLNVRLTSILFGILALGLLGRIIVEGMFRGRVRSSGKNKGGGVAVILASGIALLIIGYVGYFFGRLIQAAVSRQREFLADASAVQFTRNPLGISGALKKIGGYALGSRLDSSKATEIGHFFFAQGFRSYFGGLFATHPDLGERIRAIDPSWNGTLFEPPEKVDVSTESFVSAGLVPAVPPPWAPHSKVSFLPAAVVANAGNLTETHFKSAQALLQQVPEALRLATQTAASAQALVFAILCDDDPDSSAKVIAFLRSKLGNEIADRATILHEGIAALPHEAFLPLVQLCLPALRTLDEASSERFLATLDQAARADSVISPLELAMIKVLARTLLQARQAAPSIQFFSFQAVADDIAVVLSSLAYVGTDKDAVAEAALAAGMAQLKLVEARVALLKAEECSLSRLSQSLDRLAISSLPIRKRLLVAGAHLIGADGVVSIEEAEMYRAIAAAVDCPMPLWE